MCVNLAILNEALGFGKQRKISFSKSSWECFWTWSKHHKLHGFCCSWGNSFPPVASDPFCCCLLPASLVKPRWSEHFWLVVSTPLKNISQWGWLFSIYGKIKNVPNHQPVYSFRPKHFIHKTSVTLSFQLNQPPKFQQKNTTLHPKDVFLLETSIKIKHQGPFPQTASNRAAYQLAWSDIPRYWFVWTTCDCTILGTQSEWRSMAKPVISGMILQVFGDHIYPSKMVATKA